MKLESRILISQPAESQVSSAPDEGNVMNYGAVMCEDSLIISLDADNEPAAVAWSPDQGMSTLRIRKVVIAAISKSMPRVFSAQNL
jgi:hypothetical protein